MAYATQLRRPGVSGIDLKLRRIAAGITQGELAEKLGTTRQAVGNVEALARVSGRASERYLDALAAVSAE